MSYYNTCATPSWSKWTSSIQRARSTPRSCSFPRIVLAQPKLLHQLPRWPIRILLWQLQFGHHRKVHKRLRTLLHILAYKEHEILVLPPHESAGLHTFIQNLVHLFASPSNEQHSITSQLRSMHNSPQWQSARSLPNHRLFALVLSPS